MGNTFHIQWHITDFCNLRCRHCYQDCFDKSKDLPLDTLFNILESLKNFSEQNNRPLVLDITGGEPMMHEKWHALLSRINDCPAVAESGIITNGFFLDEYSLEQMSGFKNFKIKLSAEGLTKKEYENFRGKGTFARFAKTCRLLKDSEIEKILMFTLFPENINAVKDIFSFMEIYNFQKTVLERFVPWGRGDKIKDKLLSENELCHVLQILCEKCEITACNPEDFAPYKGFMVEKTEGRYELFGAPCIIAKDGAAIMPDGTVFPCRRFPLAIGNITEEPLNGIWNSSEILKTLKNRNSLKGKCKECIIDSCMGCRAIAYCLKGDFLEEDPLCILKK